MEKFRTPKSVEDVLEVWYHDPRKIRVKVDGVWSSAYLNAHKVLDYLSCGTLIKTHLMIEV